MRYTALMRASTGCTIYGQGYQRRDASGVTTGATNSLILWLSRPGDGLKTMHIVKCVWVKTMSFRGGSTNIYIRGHFGSTVIRTDVAVIYKCNQQVRLAVNTH